MSQLWMFKLNKVISAYCNINEFRQLCFTEEPGQCRDVLTHHCKYSKENAMKVNVNDGELECHMLSARSAPRPSGVRALDKGIPYKLDSRL
jgi:hypothetical protein